MKTGRWLRRWRLYHLAAWTALLVACSGSDEPVGERKATADTGIRVSVVSTRPDMVTGGNALLRVVAPAPAEAGDIEVRLNGADVTGGFRPHPEERRELLGPVTDLALGPNEVVVSYRGERVDALVLRNHPITGPVFSGPHETPFFCQTETFEIGNGATLGAALDDDCSVATRVDYVYAAPGGEGGPVFRPLPNLARHPADLQRTTLRDGTQAPFIVRVETGTINRAIYQTAVLHDPVDEPAPSPWSRPAAWNGDLIYRFGGGAQRGWYVQGAMSVPADDGGTRRLLQILDPELLGKGYAVAGATLNVFAMNANDLLSAETTLMVKERFIETFGAPRFTIGEGTSGGAYQSHQIANNYPGILDGIIVGASYPDVTSVTIFTVVDARLFEHYFANTALPWTEPQKLAATGFASLAFLARNSGAAARVAAVDDPEYPGAEYWSVVPEAARYHPERNPNGARATIYDHTVNVYGRDPETGFARRPLDNRGIQYGLAAFNAGAISTAQFLDLNAHIGGLDREGRITDVRMQADAEATRAAYATGRINNFDGGLIETPIIDRRGYSDDLPGGDIHPRIAGFSSRARLARAAGDPANQVMWLTGGGVGGFLTIRADAVQVMADWLAAIDADARSGVSRRDKVIGNRPPAARDTCWDALGRAVVEELRPFEGRCAELYRTHSTPRHVAGAPIANDIVACQRKPIEPADYAVELGEAEWQRLQSIFPDGVCDWTAAGIDQVPLSGTWQRLPSVMREQ